MDPHYDVAIIGGGPAGLAAGLFTARYDLHTLILDRGKSLLKRCAYLDNFLGFPGGIDVAAFLDLARSQVVEAGCRLAHRRVVTLEAGAAFTLHTERGERVSAERVIAASGYDFAYLRGISPALLDENDDVRADALDGYGRCSVPGLYIAGPLARLDNQALISAGQAAQVALGLIHDVRIDAGIRGALAKHVDWQVRRGCYDSERWAERVRAHFRACAPLVDDQTELNAMIERWILAKRAKQLASDDLKRRRTAARRLRAALLTSAAERPL